MLTPWLTLSQPVTEHQTPVALHPAQHRPNHPNTANPRFSYSPKPASMRAAVAALLFAALFALARAQPQVPLPAPPPPAVTSCGTDADLFTLYGVDLAPDPPARGSALDIVIRGLAKQDIAGGTVDVVVKLNGVIKLLSKQFSLCELAGEFEDSCPIASGEKEWRKSVDIPSIAPPGKFKADVLIKDNEGNQVGCFVGQIAL